MTVVALAVAVPMLSPTELAAASFGSLLNGGDHTAGSMVIGDSDEEQYVRFSNNTDQPVHVSTASVTGGFSVRSQDCSPTIAAGATCVVVVDPPTSAEPGPFREMVTLEDSGGVAVATSGLVGEHLAARIVVAGTGGVLGDHVVDSHSSDVATRVLNWWNADAVPGSPAGAWIILDDPDVGDRITLRVMPPINRPLEPGVYSDLTNEAFLHRPGVEFEIGGSECNVAARRELVVEDVVYDHHVLRSFRGAVVAHCALGPPVVAYINFSPTEQLGRELWVGPHTIDTGRRLSYLGPSAVMVVANGDGADIELEHGDRVTSTPSCAGRVPDEGVCTFSLNVAQRGDGAFVEPIEVRAADDVHRVNVRGFDESAEIAYEHFSSVGASGHLDHLEDRIVVDDRLGHLDVRANAEGEGQRYRIDLSIRPAGSADRLRPGLHQAQQLHTPTSGSDVVWVDAASDGRSCDVGPRSTIHIRDVVYDELGAVSALRADFDLWCDSGGRFVRGTLAYNLDLGRAVVAPSPENVSFFNQHALGQTSSVLLTNSSDVAVVVEPRVEGSDIAYYLADSGCVRVRLEPGASCRQLLGWQRFGRVSEWEGHFEPGRVDVVDAETDRVLTTVHLYGNGGGFDWDGAPPAPLEPTAGYWVLQRNGEVSALGDARHLGDAPVSEDLSFKIVSTPAGRGYWVLDLRGHVYTRGDAVYHGGIVDTPGIVLGTGEIPVSLAPTSTGDGYWIVTTHGRVVPFGDAPDIGSLHHLALAEPVIDVAVSPSGLGLYLIALDGGVFTLGDARFSGSVPQVLPGVTLDQPVVGLVPDPDGVGYWLIGGDGGVFSFGADFRGSIPSVLPPGARLRAPIIGMVAYGDAYLLVAADGGIFNFSFLPFSGSLADRELTSPVISIAPLRVDTDAYPRRR